MLCSFIFIYCVICLTEPYILGLRTARENISRNMKTLMILKATFNASNVYIFVCTHYNANSKRKHKMAESKYRIDEFSIYMYFMYKYKSWLTKLVVWRWKFNVYWFCGYVCVLNSYLRFVLAEQILWYKANWFKQKSNLISFGSKKQNLVVRKVNKNKSTDPHLLVHFKIKPICNLAHIFG